MKKTVYMALGALAILTNLGNAASVDPDRGFLVKMPRMTTTYVFNDEMMGMEKLTVVGRNIEAGQIEQATLFRSMLGERITDRDVQIAQRLTHLNEPAGDVADPNGQILAQTTTLLADIDGITPEETAVWARFYALCIFWVGWSAPEDGAQNYYMPRQGGARNFDRTMADFHGILDAYRTAVGLAPLPPADVAAGIVRP
jgi:hypothetical protein